MASMFLLEESGISPLFSVLREAGITERQIDHLALCQMAGLNLLDSVNGFTRYWDPLCRVPLRLRIAEWDAAHGLRYPQ